MRSDAREKRAALIAATWDLFALHGPDVPLRTVAAEAGVGIGTLYRHFPTRDDLVTGLIEDIAERVVTIIRRYTDGWDGTWGTWRSFVHEIADLKLAALAGQTVAVTPVDSPVWVDTEPLRRRFLAAYRGILDLAADCGFVEPGLTAWRFHLGVAAVSRPMPERAESFAPGQAEWLVDTFITGLAGSSAPRG
ncbi:TetR/AcrR family transcriptional regulator [Corynebacterium sp.]|uniref:TetR/AcrR family transcriptional regulator n=1 Tax=Corynebacterium sp. TaxID=1720 RepID=UPI0025B9BC32|nr:TetR/AcrR family transcriptional regulator [Corynebacterium sp.]